MSLDFLIYGEKNNIYYHSMEIFFLSHWRKGHQVTCKYLSTNMTLLMRITVWWSLTANMTLFMRSFDL